MAFAEKTNTALAIEGLKSAVEVSVGGGAFQRLRGADTIGYDAGERESESIPTFDGTVSILGAEGINPVTVTIPAWLPHLPIWTALRNAKRENDDIQMRIRTAPKAVVVGTKENATQDRDAAFPATSIATAATPGLVVFTKADDEENADLASLFTSNIVKVGHLIRIQGDALDRVITSIEVDDDETDAAAVLADRFKVVALPAPAAAVAAAPFEIRFPQLELLFAGGIQKLGSVNLGAGSGGALGTELMVLPNDPLDLPMLRQGGAVA